MLEGDALEKAIAGIMKRLRSVNIVYVRKIAKQIKRIGELNQSSINRLVAMSEMNADIAEIRELLRVTAAVNAKQLRTIFTKALNETFTDPRFGKYLAKYPLKNSARQNIENFVQAVYRQTAANMYNYSNTTAITQGYVEAVDKAVLAASSGVASYTETMRDTIRQLGRAGMQVQYESGYHRRLDTAVRQNIVDAVNQINKNASIMLGEEINEQAGELVYDAIEISAHARSAPDHEPVQGHVFMLDEYEKMQHGLAFKDIDGRVFAGFKRPIGEWNCRHTPMSFSTKWSQRKWTDEQLQAFIRENHEGCEIDGKHKTLYEAMQMMRDIETAVRREKDTAIAAKEAGDDELRQECQRNINSLVKRYEYIAKASGNAERRERMTVEGFRAVKVQKDSENNLTSNAGSGMINIGTGAFQKYQQKYPDAGFRSFLVDYYVKKAGIRNGIALPARPKQAAVLPDPTTKRDPYHIMHRMAERGITDDNLREYMNSARIMFVQWNGQRQVFYSDAGVVVISKTKDGWIYKTAFSKADFDGETNKILEVIHKYAE